MPERMQVQTAGKQHLGQSRFRYCSKGRYGYHHLCCVCVNRDSAAIRRKELTEQLVYVRTSEESCIGSQLDYGERKGTR